MRYLLNLLVAVGLLPWLGGCTLYSSHEAHQAESHMISMSDYALQSCIGVPDQKAQVGNAEILTYYDSATNNGVNLTIADYRGRRQSYR